MNKIIVLLVIRGEKRPIKEMIQTETKSVWIVICALGCSLLCFKWGNTWWWRAQPAEGEREKGREAYQIKTKC